MDGVRIVLNHDSAAWSEVFLNSGEIRAALESHCASAAASNTAALQMSGDRGVRPEHGFVAVIDKASHSMLGKVVTNGEKGAKSAAIKAGLPHW